MIRKNLRLCATLMTVAFLASCSGGQRSSVNPPLAPASQSAPSNASTLDQLKQVAATGAPMSELPKIGAIVPSKYGIPLARSAVSNFAQGHADLEAQLGRTDVSFSLITVPRRLKAPPTGISPMSAIEGVCGYVVTTTQYFYNHYYLGNLVSSTYMGSQVTGVTPIYCDGGGDANEIDYVIETVDCTATPTDPSCRYNDWSVTCGSFDGAVWSGAQGIYLPATTSNKGNGGQEYGVVVASDPSGGIHYSAGVTSGSSEFVDFGGIVNNMPADWQVLAFIHVHPDLYQSDDEEIDGGANGTGNHFSKADEDVAYEWGVSMWVAVGGTTDMFRWDPPAQTNPPPNYTKKPDSGNLGSVNDAGKPKCN